MKQADSHRPRSGGPESNMTLVGSPVFASSVKATFTTSSIHAWRAASGYLGILAVFRLGSVCALPLSC